MKKDSERAVQDRVAENYEAERYAIDWAREYHEWWADRMLRFSDPVGVSGVVLDAGCGTGWMLSRLEGSSLAVGLDLSMSMLVRARASGRPALQGDALELPFPNATFDLVLARSLLHHLPDLRRGLHEVARVLKPGGQAVFADTNRSPVNWLPRRLAYRGKSFSEFHQNLDRRSFLRLVGQDLQVTRVEFFGYLAYPLGFPDIMGRLVPRSIPRWLVRLLISIDERLAKVPFLRSQAWGLFVVARRRA